MFSDDSAVGAIDAEPASRSPGTYYFYGWSAESNKAWRVDAGNVSGPRDYTSELRQNPAGDLEPTIAKWADGRAENWNENLLACKKVKELRFKQDGEDVEAFLT